MAKKAVEKAPKVKKAPTSRTRIVFERAKRANTPAHVQDLEARIRQIGLDPESPEAREPLSVYADWLLEEGDLRGEMILSQIRGELLWQEIDDHRTALRDAGKKTSYKSSYKRTLKDGRVREYTSWRKTPKESELRREMRKYQVRLRQLTLSCKRWARRPSAPIHVDWELGFATRATIPFEARPPFRGRSRRTRVFAGVPPLRFEVIPDTANLFFQELAQGDSGSLLSQVSLWKALEVGHRVAEQLEAWPLPVREQITKLDIHSEAYHVDAVGRILAAFPNLWNVMLGENAVGVAADLIDGLRRVAQSRSPALRALFLGSFESTGMRWGLEDLRNLLEIRWDTVTRYSLVVPPNANDVEAVIDLVANMKGLVESLPSLASFHLHVPAESVIDDTLWESLDAKWMENNLKYPSRRWLLHSW